MNVRLDMCGQRGGTSSDQVPPEPEGMTYLQVRGVTTGVKITHAHDQKSLNYTGIPVLLDLPKQCMNSASENCLSYYCCKWLLVQLFLLGKERNI